jgi:hypothetical protein
MSCSTFDLKAYFLGELPEGERRVVEGHLADCQDCQEELDRLRLTETALLTVRDEEIPQRIAFVSDKVFEPRWWQALWNSGPRLAFASAAMLSMAILVYTFVRPAPSIAPAPVDTARIEALVQQEVGQRLEAAIAKAVAETEARQESKTAELVAAVEKRFELERKADLLAMQENFEVLQKRANVFLSASAELGGR